MAYIDVKVICGLFNKRHVKLMHAQNDFGDQTANGSPLTPMSTVHSKQTSSGGVSTSIYIDITFVCKSPSEDVCDIVKFYMFRFNI